MAKANRKQFDAMEWVKLAASDDKYGRNLNYPYSDGKRVSATDGHRLHLVSAQLPIGFIGTTDQSNQYPEIDAVFPKAKVNGFSLILGTDDIKALLNAAKFMGDMDCVMTLQKEELVFSFQAFRRSASYAVSYTAMNKGAKVGARRKLNIKYLCDALSSNKECAVYLGAEETSAILIEQEDLKLTAIVMPLRF